jgi:hypothetical protein
MGGQMMAPASVALTILRRWIRLRGDSRTISTSRRRSLSTTSAARVIRLSDRPCAMAASARMEHGATTMPLQGKEPLAMLAPTSATSCTWCARASISARCKPCSACTLRQPALDTTRCDSMPGVSSSTCSRRTPYTAPLAPEMATMMRRGNRVIQPCACAAESAPAPCRVSTASNRAPAVPVHQSHS